MANPRLTVDPLVLGEFNPLILQLGLATATVTATALIHLAGLTCLLALLQVHADHLSTPHVRLNQGVRVVVAVFALVVLHTLEIWTYAGLYILIGGFTELEPSLYFSTSHYATLGAGDVALPRRWRVLGAIEGVNGVILLGWSTAFFVSVVQNIRELEDRS